MERGPNTMAMIGARGCLARTLVRMRQSVLRSVIGWWCMEGSDR